VLGRLSCVGITPYLRAAPGRSAQLAISLTSPAHPARASTDVGFYSERDQQSPLVEGWNGRTWSLQDLAEASEAVALSASVA
jgi:hypothetical protein